MKESQRQRLHELAGLNSASALLLAQVGESLETELDKLRDLELALIQSRARIRTLNRAQRKIQVRMGEVTQGILNLSEGYEKPSEPVVPSAANAKRPTVYRGDPALAEVLADFDRIPVLSPAEVQEALDGALNNEKH